MQDSPLAIAIFLISLIALVAVTILAMPSDAEILSYYYCR